MTEPFTKEDAEGVIRTLAATLPEGVDAVLILAAPVADHPEYRAMHCLSTCDPANAYDAMAYVLRRHINGEAMIPEKLGPSQ